ncbi:unnamed protein product [Dovyalis caffra]|uniref:Uncharacterized protein n=1 Tax=Dovyalis caffra TaxID=77055 RepID=A0AAV1S7Y8_9ROSI|nr:unnamed protein product [Dovyalis caffra]
MLAIILILELTYPMYVDHKIIMASNDAVSIDKKDKVRILFEPVREGDDEHRVREARDAV